MMHNRLLEFFVGLPFLRSQFILFRIQLLLSENRESVMKTT